MKINPLSPFFFKKQRVFCCSIFAFCLFALEIIAQPGTLDPSFDLDGIRTDNFGKASNEVYATALQPDGKILLAGSCSPGKNAVFATYRLNSDGSPDVSFGKKGLAVTQFSFLNDYATAIAVLPDGKILVGGSSLAYGANSTNQSDFAIARLLPDGSPDFSFGSNGFRVFDFDLLKQDDYLKQIYPLSGGKFAIGGYSSNGTLTNAVLGQFLENGAPDPSFGVNGWAKSTDFLTFGGFNVETARMTDGRFLAAASFNAFGEDTDVRLFRFLENGQPDFSFGTNGHLDFAPTPETDLVLGLTFQTDGKILMAGKWSNGQQNDDVLVARLLPDGQADTGFDGDGVRVFSLTSNIDFAFDIAALPDGKIIVSGTSGFLLPEKAAFLQKLNADGSTDLAASTTFGTSPASGYVVCFAHLVQPDGKIFLAGTAFGDIGVARFGPDFTPDAGFATNGAAHFTIAGSEDYLQSIAVQPDGKILAAGRTYSAGLPNMLVVRYLPDGKFDPDFVSGKVSLPTNTYGASAADLILQPDGKILVGGYSKYGFADENKRFMLARLLPNGTLDNSFDGDGVALQHMGLSTLSSECNTICLRPDGKIVAGGSGPEGGFAQMRFLTDGKLDPSFGNSSGKMTTIFTDGDIYNSARLEDLQITPDGKMLAVGHGSNFGVSGNNILVARYNLDGELDPTFSSDGQDIVTLDQDQYATCVANYPDGRFLVGGFVISQPPFSIELFVRRVLPNGQDDPSFGINGWIFLGGQSPDFQVTDALAIQPDGKILVAGYAKGGSMLLRLLPDGQIDAGFADNGYLSFFKRGESFAVATQPDGKILVPGVLHPIFETDCFLARILPGDIIATGEKNAPELALSLAPNPAIESTFLNFELKENSPVSILLADMQGRVLRTVFQNERLKSGEHQIEIDVKNLPAGTYWFVIETGASKKKAAIQWMKI